MTSKISTLDQQMVVAQWLQAKKCRLTTEWLLDKTAVSQEASAKAPFDQGVGVVQGSRGAQGLPGRMAGVQ